MHLSPALAVLLSVLSSLALLPTAAGRLSATSSKGVQANSHVEAGGKTVPEILDDSMHPDIETRIVGGFPSAPGDFPWYVVSSNSLSLCGGSLIHSDVVLTAAHCAEAFEVDAGVYVGASVIDGSNEETVSRTISAVLPHPFYNDDTVANDFMLLKLSSPVSNVTPVELNEDAATPSTNQTLTVMGFGLTEEEGSASFSLLEVDIFAVNHDTCMDQYQSVTRIQEDIMFCAGFPGGGRDTCSGDSGGPVVTSDGKQVGVVSFGVGCARPDFSGVNARVSGVIDWIKQGVCDLSSSKPSRCADQPSGEDPTPAPEPESSNLLLVISHDQWVSETTFQFSQNDEIVYEGPKYEPVPYDSQNITLDQFPVGETTFTVFDSSCDGLVSKREGVNGKFVGSFQIYHLTTDGQNVLLAEGDGLFNCNASVTFDVPVESEEKCKDGKELIDVDDTTQESCSWLAQNKATHGYLCDLRSVALACPVACKACEEIENVSCQDNSGAVDMGTTVGRRNCSWLADNMNLFGYACDLKSVAFHCPVTCNYCTSSSVGTCGGGDRGNGVCADGRCCSRWGWCGHQPEYCHV